MSLLYVFLILIVVPLVGMIIGNLIIDNWDDIMRFIKNITSCLGQIITVLIVITVLGFICHWLFKDCTPKDPEVIYHDYDPGLRRKY